MNPSPTAQVEKQYIGPQPGLQMKMLMSKADICIGGGQAGAGKTFALLLEPLRHKDTKGFGAVIFRRESPQITNEGGLWDESDRLYRQIGAKDNKNDLSWTFMPEKVKVRFSHMQMASDRFAWDGSQIPLIGFDQLESFESIQFWYLLSRNRSTCGVRPYLRATCNAVPEDDPIGGWLTKLIAWWIDQETGYAIPERGGIIRWLIRVNEIVHWADSKQELIDRFTGQLPPEDILPKSFTYIPGSLEENIILTSKDPGYRANLLALPLIERERLLKGNWKIKASAGKIFNRAWFRSILPAMPDDVISFVRYWDKAGTEGAGKRSAGVLVGKRKSGRFLIAHIVKGQWSSANREAIIKQTAALDAIRGKPVEIWVEQEPGSGGKESAENTVINLAGYTIKVERVTGSKVTRAGPLAAQVEVGNVDIMAHLGETQDDVSALESFLSEAQNFDGVRGFMDQIDAASGAFNKVALSSPTKFVEVW